MDNETLFKQSFVTEVVMPRLGWRAREASTAASPLHPTNQRTARE